MTDRLQAIIPIDNLIPISKKLDVREDRKNDDEIADMVKSIRHQQVEELIVRPVNAKYEVLCFHW